MSDADLNAIADRRRGSWVPGRHGGTVPVPIEVLLAPDPELRLVWAPLHEASEPCPYDACAAESCTCCTKMLPLVGVLCHEVEGFRRENWCEECVAFEPYADIPGAGQRGC